MIEFIQKNILVEFNTSKFNLKFYNIQMNKHHIYFKYRIFIDDHKNSKDKHFKLIPHENICNFLLYVEYDSVLCHCQTYKEATHAQRYL
jgi:hypothetical protein